MSLVLPMTLRDFKKEVVDILNLIRRVEGHIRFLENLGYQYAVRTLLEAEDLYALLSALKHTSRVFDSHINNLAELYE